MFLFIRIATPELGRTSVCLIMVVYGYIFSGVCTMPISAIKITSGLPFVRYCLIEQALLFQPPMFWNLIFNGLWAPVFLLDEGN